jgi:putative transposase
MAEEKLPVQVCCRVLEVSESGFYAWRSRPPSARAIRHAWLTDVIRQVHTDSRQTYGSRRVHAELTLGRGISVGFHAVELLMRRAGLQGVTGRPKYRRGLRPEATASDLVQRQFARTGPDQLWVTDITEHPTREGKVYCAVVLDACSRRVVGWSMETTPTAALVTNALGMAIQSRKPAAGTLIHSDQGGAVHLLGVQPAGQGVWAPALHGWRRRLLRQCHDRVVLVPHAGRAARPTPLADPPGARQRDL